MGKITTKVYHGNKAISKVNLAINAKKMYNLTMSKIITHSEEETKNFAKNFAAELTGGVILCLYGELGAGKTTFVKGLAEGLQINNTITSPTFTLMNVYETKQILDKSRNIKQLIHIDTYRLKDEKELIEIGAEDYVGAEDTITVIEWPEKVDQFLKEKKVVKIFLNHTSDTEREIIIRD